MVGTSAKTKSKGSAPSLPSPTDDRIFNLLTGCTERCSSILSKLSSTSFEAPTKPMPSILDIRSDHVSISTSISKSTTNLTLAFKPPATTSAIEASLRTLELELGRVVFYSGLLGTSNRGLAAEIRNTTEDLIESLSTLLNIYIVTYSTSSSTASDDSQILRDQALRQAGQVWAAVERVQAISADELQAYNRRWKDILGVLDDCLEEVKGMADDSPVGQDDSDDEEEEAADDEDDFRNSNPLNEEEKTRVKAMHFFIRLARLLLHRLTNNASSSTKAPKRYHEEQFLRDSDKIIDKVSEKADDLAGVLEPPHDIEDIQEETDEFEKSMKELAETMKGVLQQETDEDRKELQWLKMWEKQVETARAKVDVLMKE